MLRRGLLFMATAAGALLSALIAAYVPASASAATDPITWGAPAAVDTQAPWGDPGDLQGVSCISAPLCVAVGVDGHVVSSTNPAGGRSAWQITSLPGVNSVDRVSCVDGPFCVALATDFSFHPLIATSSDPTGGASAWGVEPLSITSPVAVSCASSSFCAVVDLAGNVWTSSTPGSAASWSRTNIDGSQPLTAISCPSSTLCMATDRQGNALYSADPADPSPTWTSTDVDGSHPLSAVSCIGSGECWITDGQGNVLHSNGSTYTSAWTSVTVGDVATNSAWENISCSASACAAVSGSGYVAGSNNPTSSQASDWTVQAADSNQITPSVACLPSLCVAVDRRGNALTASDPTSTWTTTSIDGFTNLDAVSCPSASECVASDDAGGVVSSTDPAGGAGAWHRALVDSSAVDGISCPSVSLCVAGDDQGNILTSTDPAGGTGAWRSPFNLSSHPLQSISCPTVSFCVAVDYSGGNVWTSTNPSGGAGAWSSARVDGQPLWAVSCPTVSLCVAVGVNGDVLSSTDPAGGASAWSAPVPIDPRVGFEGVSCASATLCVAVDNNGTAFVATDPTSGQWAPEIIDSGGDGLSGVSCRLGPTCVAVDFSSNALASTDPARGTNEWSAPQNIEGGSANGFNGVNCSPGLLCVAVDDVGSLVVGTPLPPSAASPPTITGTAVLGAPLTESHAGWSGDPVSFTYQWEDCDAGGGACTAIPGATAQRYAVAASDIGHTLRVRETAANAGGAGAPAVSAPTVAVRSAPGGRSAPSVLARPTISGAPIVGRRLHASVGVWTGTAPIGHAYQWQACRRSCTDLAGAVGSSYLVRMRDDGARIRVEVTATNAFGTASAVSAGDGPVATVKQIRTTLLHASVPHGRGVRYATIVAGNGFTAAFAGLMPGRLRVVWKSGKVVVATGTLRFTRAGHHRLRVRLTTSGQRLLRARARGLAAEITFRPAGAKAMTFSEKFSLR